ncbi:MAG: hypothetical protein JXA82_09855 [Sedimentisphaerales bacterium]|nr:hypothetical protein [Sedimentisphaerales bacterium]
MAMIGAIELLVLAFLGVAIIITIALSVKHGKKVIPGLLIAGGIFVVLIFVIRFAGFALAPIVSNTTHVVPRVGASPILFLPILLGIITFILLIAKSKNPGKILASILVFCFVFGLLAFGFLTFSHTRVATIPYANQPVRPPSIESSAGQWDDSFSVVSSLPIEEGLPPIWHEGVEQEMPADVYPSQEAAVAALARQADKLVQKVLAGEERPSQVWVYNKDFTPLFQRELNKQLGMDAEIVQSVDVAESVDSQLVAQKILTFKLQKEDERFHYLHSDDATTRQLTGLLVLTVKYFDRFAEAQVRYHEKPWLLDFPQFQSQDRQRSYVLARSTTSATSQAQAEREAMTQATRQVAHMINQVRARTPDRVLDRSFSVSPVDLERRGMIFDRFTQQFYGAAGPIYRTALLIDTSEPKMAPLTQEKTAIMRIERITWAKMILTFLGIAGLICIVYAFLNAATRGYYTWSLRIAAIVLGLIGLFIILNFA